VTKARSRWLAAACPRCRAAPGFWCRAARSKNKVQVHASRMDLVIGMERGMSVPEEKRLIATFATKAGPSTDAGALILVDAGPGPGRWVSAWRREGSVNWTSGSYFESFDEARDHFLARCQSEKPYEE